MTNPNYTDAFVVDTSGLPSRSPEEWARAAFEGAPAAMRWFLLVGWRCVLGLRLGPLRSSEHILGWHILERTSDSVTIELYSWFLSCRVVFWLDDTELVFSTSVRYERAIGAVIWPPVSLIHNRAVPYVLKRAARPAVS